MQGRNSHTHTQKVSVSKNGPRMPTNSGNQSRIFILIRSSNTHCTYSSISVRNFIFLQLHQTKSLNWHKIAWIWNAAVCNYFKWKMGSHFATENQNTACLPARLSYKNSSTEGRAAFLWLKSTKRARRKRNKLQIRLLCNKIYKINETKCAGSFFILHHTRAWQNWVLILNKASRTQIPIFFPLPSKGVRKKSSTAPHKMKLDSIWIERPMQWTQWQSYSPFHTANNKGGKKIRKEVSFLRGSIMWLSLFFPTFHQTTCLL